MDTTTAEKFSGGTRYLRPNGTWRVETTGAAYQVLPGEDVVAVMDSDPAVTITLPSLLDVPIGTRITVKDGSGGAAANDITVDGSGAETIDGAASVTITDNFGAVTLEAGSTEWNVLSRGGKRIAVTGVRNSGEGALKNLLTALADAGLITDSTTAA